MKIKDYYVELCSNSSFYDKYYSMAGTNSSKMFYFISTNLRAILTHKNGEYEGFAQSYRVINEVAGLKRDEWITNPGAQEKEKQHTVNMRKSEFFRVVNTSYIATSRGKSFEKMIENEQLSDLEKRLLCLIYILPGFFNDIPNYLQKRVEYIMNCWKESGYTTEEIEEIIRTFIASKQRINIFYLDFTFLDTFFEPINDIDFLKEYKNATITEKTELQEYIIAQYMKRTYSTLKKNNKCVLSYKFQPGGNCLPATLFDDAMIVYVVNKLNAISPNSFEEFIDVLLTAYNELYDINKNHVCEFIKSGDNHTVFKVIYEKAMGIRNHFEANEELTLEEIERIGQIDTTNENGTKQAEQVSSALKKLAKLNANYKCALDQIEYCKYFTSKENNKNYLEIHHFIPREFANNYNDSIEILDNYIALCPNCHRKIHLAVDNERRHMINHIYSERNEKLAKHGLEVKLKDLYKYYGID